MTYPELAHMPGLVGQRSNDFRMDLFGLAINSVDVIDEEDDFNAAAALSGREQALAFGLPVWCLVCCQLDVGLSARQISVIVFFAGYDAKSEHVLEPDDRLLEVADADFYPACFGHCF